MCEFCAHVCDVCVCVCVCGGLCASQLVVPAAAPMAPNDSEPSFTTEPDDFVAGDLSVRFVDVALTDACCYLVSSDGRLYSHGRKDGGVTGHRRYPYCKCVNQAQWGGMYLWFDGTPERNHVCVWV